MAGVLISGGNVSGHDMLFPGDRGRKKIVQPGSGELVFKPLKRLLVPRPTGDDSTSFAGKKAFPPQTGGQLHRAEQRHNLPASMRSGYDDTEIEFPWASKAQVAWNDGPKKSSNARNFISKEGLLEQEMGQKGRVQNRESLRNGVTQRNPGDKFYAHPDYSPDFFKEEGSVPGSCIQNRRGQKNVAASRSTTNFGDMSDGINYRPQPSYETRKKAATLREEIDSVSCLHVPVGGEDSDDEN
mmetsp:Transcript_16134/g.32993  ORF Transcript_16134/g.32993 Transcript_16134/m.32993 type:complete len:241 (-) Transcript_16134:102-824(-)